MRIMRAGLLFLPLLLTACSLPMQQTTEKPSISEPTQSEHSEPEQKANEVKTSKSKSEKTVTPPAAPSRDDVLEQLTKQRKAVLQNIAELNNRTGSNINLAHEANYEGATAQDLQQRLEKLVSLNDSLTQQIFDLDKRVQTRREAPQSGDALQIYLSDLSVSGTSDFTAQPLVGHWTRGESRIVRLNENLLAADSNSEPLRLTFSERYQILINDELIGSFGPDREKYEVQFKAPTSDQKSEITGTLGIRVQQ